MSAGDTARSAYESARSELILRVRLRDNALLFYLAAVGTLFGLGIGLQSKPEILLTIPFVALGTGIIVAQHHEVIGALGFFLAHELDDFLKELKPPEKAPQWDNSLALKNHANTSMFYRMWSHLALLIAPCITSLGINYKHGIHSAFPYGPLWWFCLICSLIMVYIIMNSHKRRLKLYEDYRWVDQAQSVTNSQ